MYALMLAIVALGLLTPVAYMCLSPLAAAKERGELLEDYYWMWKLIARTMLVVGWPGDVLVWNFLIGSILFRELPRELTFSSRIERHARAGNERGQRWARRLNQVWPGHIK